MDGTRCYYCGALADETDHVVPQSLLRAVRDSGDEALVEALSRRNRKMTVDCCRECNGLAGYVYDQTLGERRRRIAVKFERKNRRALEMPDWTARELMDLSPMLQGYVIGSLVERDLLRERLAVLRR